MESTDVNVNHKLVHLDLKGAPPKLEYLEKIFPLLRKWGTTGLLVEYEDSFPYSEALTVLRARDSYSMEDILTLQRLAEENELIVVPLVQTFGHMEFVLKHSKFQRVREVVNFPMALCPSNPDSLQLVCTMVDQVMAAHSNLQWFHVGCDEVYHLGICDECRRRQLEDGLSPEQIFLQHVKNVAQHVRDNYPSVTPIVWDDMFRCTDLDVLKDSGLGGLVEPMVWHYLTSFQLPADFWEKLSAVFPTIWVASAFKGATGSRACVSSVAYHLENHNTWLSTLRAEQHRFTTIRGFALTGWQRYDHYAVLCELLPQALPCLSICLQTLEKGSYTADIHQNVSSDLGFTSLLPLNPFTCTVIPNCSYPGAAVYQLMIEYAFLEAHCDRFISSDGCLTWMNDYNIKRNFTNPVHLEPIFSAASAKLQQLEDIKIKLSAELSSMFSDNTVEEWLATHLQPLIDKIRRCEQTAGQQLAIGLGDDTTESGNS
ncbi:hypothetical protein V1264_010836 [Littorina saxatilis]|uniref:beta-N-acetylhexosaminidase n=2 Tax=Littorina saxatilis TaxID=31220 RepID=A0AAN9GJI0_9CAEN